jgi:hypothetical protein
MIKLKSLLSEDFSNTSNVGSIKDYKGEPYKVVKNGKEYILYHTASKEDGRILNVLRDETGKEIAMMGGLSSYMAAKPEEIKAWLARNSQQLNLN